MSLNKEVTLTVKEYTCTLNSPLKFYVNDSLDLKFIIKKFGINNQNNTQGIVEFSLAGLNVELMIENGEGVDSIESATVSENMVVFRIEKKHTRYKGIGKMMIKLTDDDGCEVKIPPFEYEVKPTINEVADNVIPDQILKTVSTEDGKLLLTEDGKLLVY